LNVPLLDKYLNPSLPVAIPDIFVGFNELSKILLLEIIGNINVPLLDKNEDPSLFVFVPIIFNGFNVVLDILIPDIVLSVITLLVILSIVPLFNITADSTTEFNPYIFLISIELSIITFPDNELIDILPIDIIGYQLPLKFLNSIVPLLSLNP